MEIKSNFGRKKLHRTQSSNFLGDCFSSGDNVRPQSNLEDKDSPNILKDDFSSGTEPSIITLVAPELIDWSNSLQE